MQILFDSRWRCLMKKLMYVMFTLNLIFLLFCTLWNFTVDNDMRLYDGKASISIEKPKEMSNKEYLVCLEKQAEMQDTDIFMSPMTIQRINIAKTFMLPDMICHS